MRRNYIKENLEKIYSRLGYTLLELDFITDKMIRIILLTPRWTIKEILGLVEVGFDGNIKVRILRG
jgi:hypothetical protein